MKIDNTLEEQFEQNSWETTMFPHLKTPLCVKMHSS